jgi:hypothetical protein
VNLLIAAMVRGLLTTDVVDDPDAGRAAIASACPPGRS